MSKFTHLHLHSHYSLLDGLTKPSALVSRVKELGMDSVAITDHGNMYGAIEFYKLAKEQGIKPIIGCELYVTRDMSIKEKIKDNPTWHLIALAMNNTGYKNLCKLVTEANIKGFYYKPRIDFSLLEKYNEGLIILSGCLGGELSQAVLKEKDADEIITRYKNLLGDRYYIEIQRHENNEEQGIVTPKLIELAKKHDIPVVATSDSHYLCKEDAHTHDVLLAIQTQSSIDDKDRLSLKDDDFSVHLPEEMAEKFKDIPEAITNSQVIADRCNVEIELGKYRLPHFNIEWDNELSHDEYLYIMAREGLFNRFGYDNTEYIDRLNYELDVITKTGFASYMLIVWDIVQWAKKQGIRVGPGRGSAAGSLISYCLGITGIDPIKYGLLFERFMNPDRISMPDIDIDFEDRRRDEVINYTKQKYGEDFVAQIITFGSIFARSSIRDVGRATKYDPIACDRIAKALPMNMSISEAIEKVPDVAEEYMHHKDLMDIAISLEGIIRHAGTHACGVVIGDKPLVEYMPLQRSTRNEEQITTQYDMGSVEELGLLKMDFLGLRNLSVISDTIKLIKKNYELDLNIDLIPLDDKMTFRLLQDAKTTSIFQLESGGMKKYLKDLKPTEFNDITVMVSLYRPGPMELIPTYIARKQGRESPEYLHPLLEPIMKDTYGIMVYQEQLMSAVRALAGFTLAEADILRKAVGKKIKKLLMEQEGKFKRGCANNGIPKNISDKFWSLIEPFSRYGFNKSHAVAYAMIAYQTAFLKANYPLEFMTSEINSDPNTERITELLSEFIDMGIKVSPPDINESGYDFSGVKNVIRFSVASIKGVNSKLVSNIVNERDNGKFKSLGDFVNRMIGSKMTKTTLDRLSMVGALDSLHENRNTLLQSSEQILEYMKVPSIDLAPQLVLPEISNVTVGQRLVWEKDLLGFYLSANPAKQYIDIIHRNGGIDISRMNDTNGTIKIGGIISGVKKVITKTGKTIHFATLNDGSSIIEIPIFSNMYAKLKDIIAENNAVLLTGKVDRYGDRERFICYDARLLGSIV